LDHVSLQYLAVEAGGERLGSEAQLQKTWKEHNESPHGRQKAPDDSQPTNPRQSSKDTTEGGASWLRSSSRVG
jgi:hypothetical protein